MHGVYDHARPARLLAKAQPSVLPSPLSHKVGTSKVSFAAQYPARLYPCQRFARSLAGSKRMTRGLSLGWPIANLTRIIVFGLPHHVAQLGGGHSR